MQAKMNNTESFVLRDSAWLEQRVKVKKERKHWEDRLVANLPA